MTDRAHLSIGEVLELLVVEFPDVTISKIRFLESRGLIRPERTPSGYRRFYPDDVERLEWILRQQREHYLPLDVIKGRLESKESAGERAPAPLALSLFEQPRADHGLANHGLADPGLDDRGLAEPGLDDRGLAEPGLAKALLVKAGARRADAGAGTEVGARAPARSAPARSANGQRALPDTVSSVFGEHLAGPGADASAGPCSEAATSDLDRAKAPEARVAGGVPEARDPVATAPVEVHDEGEPRGEPHSVAQRGADEREIRVAPGAEGAADGPWTGGEGEVGGPRSAVGESTVTDQVVSPRRSKTQRDRDRTASVPQRAGGPPQEHVQGPAVKPAIPAGTPGSLPRGFAVASMSAGELAQAAGVGADVIAELLEFGLISSRSVAGDTVFDDEALVVARAAGAFRHFGVEARHLRSLKHAAEREAGLFAQVVTPLLRQRNPTSRSRALEEIEELVELGSRLRDCFLRAELRSLTGS